LGDGENAGDFRDGDGVGSGEAGVLEELVAGESCDDRVFRFGEFAEALDGHGEVGLGEEAGLFLEELGAEFSVGFVLSGEEELLDLAVFQIELGEEFVELGGVREILLKVLEDFGARGGGRWKFRSPGAEFRTRCR